MRVHVLQREQRLPAAPDAVFPFFADAANLEAITPPLLRFRVITPRPIEMGAGTFIQYALRLRGLPVRWDTLIEVWEPPHRFVDVQLRGPYALWEHTHTFEPAGEDAVVISDRVRYALPFGRLGELARRLFVRRDLDRIFDHRMRAIAGRLT
jgi:ligand-binding SRPBCC domain-containing protein